MRQPWRSRLAVDAPTFGGRQAVTEPDRGVIAVPKGGGEPRVPSTPPRVKTGGAPPQSPGEPTEAEVNLRVQDRLYAEAAEIINNRKVTKFVTESKASKPWPRPAPGALALPLKPQGVTGGGKRRQRQDTHTGRRSPRAQIRVPKL